jgi:hypothetical protein
MLLDGVGGRGLKRPKMAILLRRRRTPLAQDMPETCPRHALAMY